MNGQATKNLHYVLDVITNSKQSSISPLNILMATRRFSLLLSIPIAMPLATWPNAPLPITLTKTRLSLGISQIFSDSFGSTGGITLYSWRVKSNGSFGGVPIPESVSLGGARFCCRQKNILDLMLKRLFPGNQSYKLSIPYGFCCGFCHMARVHEMPGENTELKRNMIHTSIVLKCMWSEK